MNEENLINERKEKALNVLKKNYNLVVYAILAIILFISVKIRTRNLSRLRDVTTGGWTLGPDLDPFLFLRWAKYIVENGSLMAIDSFRYMPVGFRTKGELILHPYMIAWFHKVASVFGSVSVEQSAALYPVFFFAITVIAFFFLTREIFKDKLNKMNSNFAALVASFFLSVLPVILPRTIAGIPEKESPGFFFLFATFYFFLLAWRSENVKIKYTCAILAGILTAGMALVWGGYIYLFVTIGASVLIAFMLGKIDKKRIYMYTIWLASALIIMNMFSLRYRLSGMINSATTGIVFFTLAVIWGDWIIHKTRIKDYFVEGKLKNIPRQIKSLVVVSILAILLASIFFGVGFVPSKISNVVGLLVKPSTDRLGVTVAENRQPYFSEWASSFGPELGGFPILFWIMFIGSIYLFGSIINEKRNKQKWILIGSYTLFLTALIFSRYKPNSIFDGEGFASLAFYMLGALVFLGALIYYYLFLENRNEFGKLRGIKFSSILLFSFFAISLISVRGAVRLIMMLVPSVAIISSYFVFSLWEKGNPVGKDKNIAPLVVAGLIALALIFAGYYYYQASNSIAQGYAPSSYTQQWQKAMSWVRESTPENSVFAHWWDYGYWVQSIGERATVLDGGNAIPYWNHFMGRYVLTGDDNTKALEFLFAHNATHFLIDSSDIGKYTAFSSIGSDEQYDRRSWLQTFLIDDSQTSNLKNSTLLLYRGGFSLDGDIIYEENGSKIFLPGVEDANINQNLNVAGLGAIIIERSNNEEIKNVEGIFVYNGQQYKLPIRYVFDGRLIDLGRGVDAGIYLMPAIKQGANGLNVQESGALIYLSDRTVHSQLARLYLFNEKNPSFEIVKVEDDIVVESLKSQGISVGDTVYYNGFRGPIKIWEINYPSEIEFKEEYLNRRVP